MWRFALPTFALLVACSGDRATDTETQSTADTDDTADSSSPDSGDPSDTADTSSPHTPDDVSDTNLADSSDTLPTNPCEPRGCGEACGHEELWTCEPLSAGETCVYGGEAPALTLLAGLRRLDFAGGLPSRLIVHGQNAFPVLVDDRYRVVLAGAFVDQGRAVVLGHEGPMSHTVTSGTGFAGLWQNTMSFLAAQPPGQTTGVIGFMPGFENLASDLAALGWTTRPMQSSDLTTAGLADVDVLVMDTYAAHPAATLTALHTWLRNGGGLLAGGHAWWWATDPDHTDAASNYPGNALLAPTGITIVESTASDAPYPLPESQARSLDHAAISLTHLARAQAGCLSMSREDLARAAASAGSAIDVLPLDSAFFDAARPFNDTIGPVIPTSANPLVPTSDPTRALAARLQIRLALDAPPEQITAHPASTDFPGPVLPNAPRITRTLTLDATTTGVPEQLAYGAPNEPVWRSTGLYAAPGELVEVTVPARATTAGLRVQIGIHTDTLWEADAWTRLPRIVATRPLESPTTRIASGFGGPIFITVPVGTSLGELEVTIANAVAMLTFEPGDTWPTDLADRPHPAPWAELAGSSFILHVPTADALAVTEPTTLMTLWDRIQDQNAWLAGLPTTRPRAERFVVDRQISAGWMHSGYPMMAHLESTTELLTLTAPTPVGAWGPLHELGHNHQNLDWVLPNTTESSVNLWSVYISEEVLSLDRDLAHPDLAPAHRAARIDAWLAGTDRDWSVWMALETYLQLQEAFGWDLYHRLFARYFTLAPNERPATDEARLQTFITLASLESGRDLSAFFAAWGLVADPTTLDAIDHLPAWLDHPLAR